jgi:tetratricopeptide (TPR) repeat protein
MKQAILAEPILVGRERELEELLLYLQTAIDGRGRTVFISAEAGIGKTRLVTEFLNSVKKENITKLSGWCLFNAGVPYFPFIEAFSNYYSTLGEKASREDSKLNIWLKEPPKALLSAQLKYLTPQSLKDQTFEVVAKTIRSIATQNPVIFVIEDIHWADSASLALLHYIARAIHDSEKVLVLATFRSEELTSDSEGYPHQLAETLVAMRREDLFRKIELPSLTPSSITRMAESMLGGRLQQSLSEKLAVESEGNPLFVVESLRMLHEHNNLVQENDVWRLRTEKLGVPVKIRDILIQRLACLNNAQKRLLDAASVIGDYFETGLLSAIVEQDSLEVLETLNVIAHSTSLILADESRYRFDHARSREIIYESLSQPLKQGYHKKIAETLENTKSKNLRFSELARHYAQAGNKEKAVKYSLKAGQIALSRFSNVEAIKHFESVLENISKNPKNSEAIRTAREGLGDAYHANSMFKEAMRTFEELSNSETGVIKLRSFRKAMESAFQCMDIPHLMKLVKEAEPYAAFDRLESARVLMNRGRAYGMRFMATFAPEDLAQALEDHEVALRVFEDAYSLWDCALALLGVGAMHTFSGASQKGVGEMLRAIALFEELGDFRFQMEACWAAGSEFVGVLLLNHEAFGVLAKIIEINEKMKMGDYNRLVYAYAYSAVAHEFTSDWDEALSFSLKALEASKKTDNLVAPGIVYANLCREYVGLGDLRHAEEYFEKFMKLPPEVHTNVLTDGTLTKAVFFAAKCQWKESNQFFEARAIKGRAHIPFKLDQARGGEVRGRLFYAWALEREGRPDEAEVQLEEAQKAIQEMEERFAHTSLQASFMVRRGVSVDKEFEMRLDLVNASRKPGLLVKAEGIIPSDGFKVTTLPPDFSLQNECVEMKNREIGAFQVVTAKFTLMAMKAGVFTLNPKVVYLDELGRTKTSSLEPTKITVEAESSTTSEERATPVTSDRFEFKSEVAQKAFDYLENAFLEDYVQRRLPYERSGWRTLMDIVKQGRVSQYSLYGASNRRGVALSELEHLGVVEARLFEGERGRGGKIRKLRVAYKKENVKRHIDQYS